MKTRSKTTPLFYFLLLLMLSGFISLSAQEEIRYNQLGYYPDAIKEFVVTDSDASSFKILDSDGTSVFKGKLSEKGHWEASGEKVQEGHFSGLTEPGNYTIELNTGTKSATFEIRTGLYDQALDASIKSFYFQRASMAIEKRYGGIYARKAGHPDNHCLYHASSTHTKGKLNSPGGWYDAGDYGKYIVNAAITVSQMLNLLELNPDAVPSDGLNIPESGNGTADLLDEIRYELDWMLSMQDEDGGVYHKLTALNFGGFIMPEAYDLDRYIIGKGTFSTLAFSATMSQAARVYKNLDADYAAEMQEAAVRAWIWAVDNPDLAYRNPKDVSTGEYGDNEFSDDFYWAAAELYISTGDDVARAYLKNNEQKYWHQITNSWKFFTRNMGFHSLLINGGDTGLESKHMKLADQFLENTASIPYGISIDHFEWGSNSDVLNQAMILCIAHHLSGEQKYLDGAIRNTDYIFGKNATGYSFLTGFGSKQVMNPHHRPSGADGIEKPVPGFILGGPNIDRQDSKYVDYPTDFPAKAFADVQPSFASNEVCLNWNAPAVFVLGYLQMLGL